jgi:aspartate aminotransferase
MANQYAPHRSHMPDVNLNLNVRGLKPSATVAINERCNELIRSGRSVFKLGLGQSPFPVPSSVVDALRTHADRKDYLAVRGLTALRSAVADYHRRRQGLSSSWEDVLVGPGSKELMFLLQLVYYGDLVVPTPSWVSYAPQAAIIGRKISWLNTDRESSWQITPERFEELCHEDPQRPRIVVLNYPNNPTGGSYKLAELKAIAEVARRHRVILLSDEIYGELHFRGQHVSVARFYPEGTIVSGGLSKWCGAGGWRLGVFVFPPPLRWLLDAMAAVASETYTSTSAPIQYAGVKAYYGGLDIERYLWHSRRILSALGRCCRSILTKAGIDVAKPQGAFYLFPDFSPLRDRLAARGIRDSTALCERLLEETGVAILPGVDFGRRPVELTARLAYVNFDGASALAASEHLPKDAPLDEPFLRRCCRSTLEAVERIAAWVESG